MKTALLVVLFLCFAVSKNFAQTTDPVPPPAPVKYQPTTSTQQTQTADTVKKTVVVPSYTTVKKKVEPVDNTATTLFYRRSNTDLQGSYFSAATEFSTAHGYGGYGHWTQPFDAEEQLNLGLFASVGKYSWSYRNTDQPEQYTYKGSGTEVTGGVLLWGIQEQEAWSYQALRVGGFWLRDQQEGGWQNDVRWKNTETFAGIFASYEAVFYSDESQPFFSRGTAGAMYWRPMSALSEATLNGIKVKNDAVNKEKWYLYYKQSLLTKKISKYKGVAIGTLFDYTDEKRGVTTWGFGLNAVIYVAKNQQRNELLELQLKATVNPADNTKNGMGIFGMAILHIPQIF